VLSLPAKIPTTNTSSAPGVRQQPSESGETLAGSTVNGRGMRGSGESRGGREGVLDWEEEE